MNPDRSPAVGYSDAFQALMLIDALHDLTARPQILPQQGVDSAFDPIDGWAGLQQMAGSLRLSLGQTAWMRVALWRAGRPAVTEPVVAPDLRCPAARPRPGAPLSGTA